MTQIRTLFDAGKDIQRAIEKVITYQASQEQRLRAEISEYIATESIEQQLEQLLEKMQRSEASASDWITVHRQFHERLCSISDAPRLMHQISSLHSMIEPLMRIWMENSPSVSHVQHVHRDILETLRAGDAAAVETLMRAHILRTIAGITAPGGPAESAGNSPP